jgi:hypothetical protein
LVNASTYEVLDSEGGGKSAKGPTRTRRHGTVMMNADYWEKRTALIRDGAVRLLSLFKPEEVDYWRDELKANRKNLRQIELMTWTDHQATLRGRAQYGRLDEVAEYVFRFIRTSEGGLLKFGAVAFSKRADTALARQVIEVFEAQN